MGEEGVANDMTTHVSMTVGSFRTSKETESHYIPQCRKSVFRVVENRHAVSEFREISPFMTHHLEFRMIPGCIIMSRSFNNPKLRFIGRLSLLTAVEMGREYGITVNIDGKLRFQEFPVFMPFDFRFELQISQRIREPLRIIMHTGDISIQRDGCLNPTFLTDFMFDEESHTQRSLINDSRFPQTKFMRGFQMI